MVIPAGTYPDNLFGSTGSGKKSPTKTTAKVNSLLTPMSALNPAGALGGVLPAGGAHA